MTTRSIQIRQATIEDVGVLAVHRVSMFRDMGSVDSSIEPALLDAATTQIREAMSAGEYLAWVAHPAGAPEHIIGGGGIQLRRLLPRPDDDGKRVLIGREAIVLNMYVESEWRRRGVARRIMQHILAWIPGSDVVRLVLHASDEGRPLYQQLGFVPTNEMRYDLEHRKP